MRVPLDENVDRRLKQSFGPEHEVVTVRERGWHGTRNGELLRAAASEFDVMVTLDTNLQHQQNLLSLDLAIQLTGAIVDVQQALTIAQALGLDVRS